MASRRIRLVLRWVGLGILLLLLALQLATVERTNPPVGLEVDAPAEVHAVLRKACYDCHSHETRWPWYSRVAPLSWWLASHVEDGRGDLNFSEWPAFDFELQEHALEDIYEQLTKGEMPPWSYTVIHADARLSEADRQVLLRWARGN
jgi:hypothetical protein